MECWQLRKRKTAILCKGTELISDVSLERVLLCLCEAFREGGKRTCDTVFFFNIKSSCKGSAQIHWLSHDLQVVCCDQHFDS